MRPISFCFSELPHGKYHWYDIDNRTHKGRIEHFSGDINTNYHKKDLPIIGEVFFLKNYRDTHVCVYDGDIIWSDTLINYMSKGGSHVNWLLAAESFWRKLKVVNGDPDKIRIILTIENL